MFVIFKILKHSTQFCSDDLEWVDVIRFDSIPIDEASRIYRGNRLDIKGVDYNINNIELTNYGYTFAYREIIDGVAKADFLIVNTDCKNLRRNDIESLVREIRINQIIND